MSTIPDPQTVREIAREYVLNDPRRAYDISPAILGKFGPDGLTKPEYHAYCDAVREAIKTATVTVSWPDEQPQEFACEVCTKSITAYPCVLCEHEPDPWNKCGRHCAEMHTYEPGQCELAPKRAEQPQDERDGDVRVRAFLNLHAERFAHDVITALAVGDGRTLELTRSGLTRLLNENKRLRELAIRTTDKLVLAPKDQCAALLAYDRTVIRCERIGDHWPALHAAQFGDGARVEWRDPEPSIEVDAALDARDAKATPTTGWILWDADGRWIGATTSPSDNGWRAVSINDAEAQEWQQRNCILDRMDEAGWRAYNEGDKARWQFEPGSRDEWLAARDAKGGE